MIFPGFGENRETGSEIRQTGDETGSEWLKNGSNDFLHIWCINTLQHVFQNVLVVYDRKIDGNPKLVTKFLLSEVPVLKKQLERFSLNTISKFSFRCLFRHSSHLLQKNCWKPKFGRFQKWFSQWKTVLTVFFKFYS